MRIDREIMRLSVPAILSNVTVPLLGLCDTAISGHLGDAACLGAIAVGSMMLNVVFWLFGFLRMGTTGLTAQALGKGSGQGVAEAFTRSCLLALILGVLLIALREPLFSLLTMLIAPGPEVAPLARRYFSICIWESPATLLIMAVSGWLIGMQTTFWPMVTAITVNVVNIALSLTLVFACGAGFAGVATGTLAANWAGVGVALWAATRCSRGRPLLCPLSTALKGGELGKFFSVNSDLFLRSACIMAVTLAMTAFGSRLGTLALAANAVVMQFFHFFSFFMDGLAFTGEALVGRFAGARDRAMTGLAVRRTMLWSGVVAVTFFIIYMAAWRPVTDMLTDLPDVRATVAGLRVWIVAIPPVTVAAFIFDGCYIGATATRRMLLAAAVAATAFFAISYSGLDTGLNPNMQLWLSFMVYLALRGALLGALWPSTMRRLRL